MKSFTTLKTDSRGVGAVVIVLIVVLVLAGVGGVAYYALRARGSSLLPAKFNDKCEYDDKELCRFLNNFSTKDNFTVVSKSTVEGKTTETKFIIDGEDKTQFVTTADGKESYNVINIGNTTYTKDYSDSKWFKQTTEPSQETATEEEDESFSISDEDKDPQKVTYKFVAKDACGKVDCLKYQVIQQGQQGTTYIWFDTKDYLMRRYQVELEGQVSTAEYSYDKVNISEPSPTKEGTPGFPGLSAPSTETTPTPEAEIPADIPSFDYAQ